MKKFEMPPQLKRCPDCVADFTMAAGREPTDRELHAFCNIFGCRSGECDGPNSRCGDKVSDLPPGFVLACTIEAFEPGHKIPTRSNPGKVQLVYSGHSSN